MRVGPEEKLLNISFDFSGRTALVTGAAQGIGFELCWMFAERGAKVIPVDRDVKALKSAWGSASEFALPVAVDVADSKSTAELISTCVEWGGLDIVINNGQIAHDDHAGNLNDSE
jgi:3-oxoacyl-[acyl-carrier protein] reductase